MNLAFLLTSLLHAASASPAALNHACHFAGARFARIVSTCEEGVCTGLTRHGTGQFEQTSGDEAELVSCDDARESVYEFLAASGVPLRRPKRFGRDHRDAPELLELLRVSVVPLLEPLSFGSIGTEQPLSGFKRSDDRALVLVTYALAVIMYGTDEGVISPPPEFDVRFLEDESVPWGLGLGLYFGDSFGILRLPTVILLEDFIAHEYPYGVGSEEFSLERLGASAQAFGRLVGLCIVHDSDVSYLRLPLGVVKMLHPRFRMLVKTKADFIAQLGSTSLDAFAEFSGGVYDALNPGGFYMFSPDKWLSLFTYIPDAPLAL